MYFQYVTKKEFVPSLCCPRMQKGLNVFGVLDHEAELYAEFVFNSSKDQIKKKYKIFFCFWFSMKDNHFFDRPPKKKYMLFSFTDMHFPSSPRRIF